MITLTNEQIKRLHKKLLDTTGGLELASGTMSDKQLLDLILERSK